ncbi:uncharacterized protein LOC110456727 [Mizuhopecten yessoensis]|uniref:uncharacterized protein LOC110456727 n=1 Tax=Mizuhopecten yessoensis TaxID=6573 RepID=UPI000B45A68C|nr:uncharacterized protein LOC110456727 [Mizuhopecten yessoensis]
MKFSITAKGLCLLLWMVAFLHEGQAQICPLGCTPQYELITESCRKLIFFRRRCTRTILKCNCETTTTTTTTTTTVDPDTFLRNICLNRPRDVFHLADPRDETKFVQCDAFNVAYLRSCGIGRVWSVTFRTCVRQ